MGYAERPSYLAGSSKFTKYVHYMRNLILLNIIKHKYISTSELKMSVGTPLF